VSSGLKWVFENAEIETWEVRNGLAVLIRDRDDLARLRRISASVTIVEAINYYLAEADRRAKVVEGYLKQCRDQTDVRWVYELGAISVSFNERVRIDGSAPEDRLVMFTPETHA
jgi:hypothetical protein